MIGQHAGTTASPTVSFLFLSLEVDLCFGDFPPESLPPLLFDRPYVNETISATEALLCVAHIFRHSVRRSLVQLRLEGSKAAENGM